MMSTSETGAERAVAIPADGLELAADLAIPPSAAGAVAFAHGSGSGRHSPRNRQVAARLREAGLGTLLLDLLTEEEEHRDRRTGELRFDVTLLGRRLVAAIDWLAREQSTAELPVGCFGASTGAAAALIAAARQPDTVRAVVSRAGRPDLAAGTMAKVRAPVLLIVGGADPVVLDLNRRALRRIHAGTRLEIVEGATHLFEEPGALERVSELAREWFVRHLPTGGTA